MEEFFLERIINLNNNEHQKTTLKVNIVITTKFGVIDNW